MLLEVIPAAGEEAAKIEKVRGNPIRPAVLDTNFLPRKDEAEVSPEVFWLIFQPAIDCSTTRTRRISGCRRSFNSHLNVKHDTKNRHEANRVPLLETTWQFRNYRCRSFGNRRISYESVALG